MGERVPAVGDGIIALIPAAGFGSRLGDSLRGSKEAVEVAGRPLAIHLLGRISTAGIGRALVVLRKGKWDLPTALLAYPHGLDLAYVVVDETPSELHSVARGLAFAQAQMVALGYPDIVFRPKDAFSALIREQADTAADIVLGLFPHGSPDRVDMVELDDEGFPIDVVIKQPDRGLRLSWSIAFWTQRFSDYILDFVARMDESSVRRVTGQASVGHVIRSALDDGLRVGAVVFEDGSYIDVGTPEDLVVANRVLSQ